MITDLNKQEVGFISGGVSWDQGIEIAVGAWGVISGIITLGILVYKELYNPTPTTGNPNLHADTHTMSHDPYPIPDRLKKEGPFYEIDLS